MKAKEAAVDTAGMGYLESLPRRAVTVWLPLSVFLFPSFVLWKVGSLLGAPFDAVEWGTWRWWQSPVPMSDEEREAIERTWDERLYYTEYPVTPIYPLPGTEAGPTR